MNYLVPTLVSQLQEPSSAAKDSLHQKFSDKSLAKLTHVGGLYPGQFSAVMQARPELRARLEAAVKAQRGQAMAKRDSERAVADSQAHKPSIQLKMDFSNFKK